MSTDDMLFLIESEISRSKENQLKAISDTAFTYWQGYEQALENLRNMILSS